MESSAAGNTPFEVNNNAETISFRTDSDCALRFCRFRASASRKNDGRAGRGDPASARDRGERFGRGSAILPLFSEAESYEDARAFLLSHGREIQRTAEAVLDARGLDYGVQLSLGTETFPDRTYGDTLFPAGEYDALCVRLGAAQGHNWWCVLFPPLCIVSETGEPVDLDDIEPESALWNWIKSLF